jgi:hypothetical protein
MRIVQRDNADTDEPRARNALQSSRAGSAPTCGCSRAIAVAPSMTLVTCTAASGSILS